VPQTAPKVIAEKIKNARRKASERSKPNCIQVVIMGTLGNFNARLILLVAL